MSFSGKRFRIYTYASCRPVRGCVAGIRLTYSISVSTSMMTVRL